MHLLGETEFVERQGKTASKIFPKIYYLDVVAFFSINFLFEPYPEHTNNKLFRDKCVIAKAVYR